jgi:hypothetical protein
MSMYVLYVCIYVYRYMYMYKCICLHQYIDIYALMYVISIGVFANQNLLLEALPFMRKGKYLSIYSYMDIYLHI